MIERESGHYWVKQMGEWEIMRWSLRGSWHTTDEMIWYDREVEEIDETPIVRGDRNA